MYNYSFFPGLLTPATTVAGCIDIYENVLPNCDEIIEAVEAECSNPDSDLNWTKATTLGDGQYQYVRTNYDLNITNSGVIYNNTLAKDIHNQLEFILMASVNDYIKRYNIFENLTAENFNMLKYSENQYYKEHYDGNSSSSRVISAILYLNSNYDGGEIEFKNFGVTIKPQPGMLLLFPSNYAYSHIAHPVISGVKYGIVTWLKDR